jgi:hypothetical protein
MKSEPLNTAVVGRGTDFLGETNTSDLKMPPVIGATIDAAETQREVQPVPGVQDLAIAAPEMVTIEQADAIIENALRVGRERVMKQARERVAQDLEGQDVLLGPLRLSMAGVEKIARDLDIPQEDLERARDMVVLTPEEQWKDINNADAQIHVITRSALVMRAYCEVCADRLGVLADPARNEKIERADNNYHPEFPTRSFCLSRVEPYRIFGYSLGWLGLNRSERRELVVLNPSFSNDSVGIYILVSDPRVLRLCGDAFNEVKAKFPGCEHKIICRYAPPSD